jgi:hypothetical protein
MSTLNCIHIQSNAVNYKKVCSTVHTLHGHALQLHVLQTFCLHLAPRLPPNFTACIHWKARKQNVVDFSPV